MNYPFNFSKHLYDKALNFLIFKHLKCKLDYFFIIDKYSPGFNCYLHLVTGSMFYPIHDEFIKVRNMRESSEEDINIDEIIKNSQNFISWSPNNHY